MPGTPESSKSKLREIKCSIKAFKIWPLKVFKFYGIIISYNFELRGIKEIIGQSFIL